MSPEARHQYFGKIQKLVFDGMDAITGWAVGATGAGGLATTLEHITGDKALTFNKIAGGVLASIEKTIATDNGYKIDAVEGDVVLQVYLSTLTDVKYLHVDIGTDSSNYTRFTILDTDLSVGWQEVTKDLRKIASVTGNGMDSDGIKWVRFGIEFDAAGDTLADIRIDDLSFRYGDKPIPVEVIGAGGTVTGNVGILDGSDVRMTPADESTLAAQSAKLPATLGAKVGAASMSVVPATDHDLAKEATLAAQSAKLPTTLGQKAKAASLAVTLPTDLDTVPIDAEIVNLDCMEATAGWSAVQDVSGFTITDEHICGQKALTWDKSGGTNVLSAIERTFSPAFSTGDHPASISTQFMLYLPSLTNINYIVVRLGTDASNYIEFRWAAADLIAGWNVLAAPMTDREYPVTGTGLNTASITYGLTGVVMNVAANTLSGIIADNLILFHSLETVLRQSPVTNVEGPVNLGSVTIKDRNSGSQADVESDGAHNALHVKSNSLATEASLVTIDAVLDAINAELKKDLLHASFRSTSGTQTVKAAEATFKFRVHAFMIVVEDAGAETIELIHESGSSIVKSKFGAEGGGAIPIPKNGVVGSAINKAIQVTNTGGNAAWVNVWYTKET